MALFTGTTLGSQIKQKEAKENIPHQETKKGNGLVEITKGKLLNFIVTYTNSFLSNF